MYFLLLITQITFTCSKSTIESLEKGVKYIQSDFASGVVLVSLLLTLNIFHIVNFEHVISDWVTLDKILSNTFIVTSSHFGNINQSLREKFPSTEFFCFFLVRIQENKDQKILRIWTLFTQ